MLVLQRILSVQYTIPDYVHISVECRHLLSRIFVANPAKVYNFIMGLQIFRFIMQFPSTTLFTWFIEIMAIMADISLIMLTRSLCGRELACKKLESMSGS